MHGARQGSHTSSGGGIRKWAWPEVQLAVVTYVRLQPQNTEDESRGTTQTGTAKSYEKSPRSGRAGVVKVGEFSNQIPLPQTTGRDEPQCRGTIRNVFEVRTKAFSKSTSYFFEKLSVFAKSHVATTQLLLFVYLRQLTLSPKHKLSVTPCVVLCIALWALKRFTYIAAELYFWLEKYDL